MSNQRWLSCGESSKILGISQATIWTLKNNDSLVAGVHWLYVTGKRNSNVLFNVDEIREWQKNETQRHQQEHIDAAKKIASYQKVGV